jgi:hypothetical protein
MTQLSEKAQEKLREYTSQFRMNIKLRASEIASKSWSNTAVNPHHIQQAHKELYGHKNNFWKKTSLFLSPFLLQLGVGEVSNLIQSASIDNFGYLFVGLLGVVTTLYGLTSDL